MTTKFHKVSQNEWMQKQDPTKTPERWLSFYDDLAIPERKTAHSSGYDFTMPYSVLLKPGDSALIPTGIKVELKPNQELLLFPRSSKGFNFYMRLANTIGKIDSDYYNNPDNEGHIMVKIRNEGDQAMELKKGEGFVQGTIYEFQIVDGDSLDSGKTRQGGIGSTDELATPTTEKKPVEPDSDPADEMFAKEYTSEWKGAPAVEQQKSPKAKSQSKQKGRK